MHAQRVIKRLVVRADGAGRGLVALAVEGQSGLDADEGDGAVVGYAVGPGLGGSFDVGCEVGGGYVCGEDGEFSSLFWIW